MRRRRAPIPRLSVLIVTWAVAVTSPPAAEGVPSFARRHEVTCGQCHVVPPKLNDFGQRYAAAGYELPELTQTPTVPIAVWISGRTEARPVSGDNRRAISPFINRVELVSGARLRPWLSYFLEWRLVSQETRGDGTLRDRSGRIEDAFLLFAPGRRLSLTAGQFRQIEQVDVSLRLSLSEPLALSATLPGKGGNSPRRAALRAFSPAGRSPALRLAWNDQLTGDWDWTVAVTVPTPGELSVPLTSEARREASNEIEWRAKGVVIESFVSRGLTSYGAHLFYDDGDRHLVNGIASGGQGPFYWTAIAGFDAVEGRRRSRWSLEGQYLPAHRWGLGARLEDRAADGADPALIPYATWHLPRGASRFTVTLEQRLQSRRNSTLLEAGWLF